MNTSQRISCICNEYKSNILQYLFITVPIIYNILPNAPPISAPIIYNILPNAPPISAPIIYNILPNAPPISAPLVGMLTFTIPQSEPLGLQIKKQLKITSLLSCCMNNKITVSSNKELIREEKSL